MVCSDVTEPATSANSQFPCENSQLRLSLSQDRAEMVREFLFTARSTSHSTFFHERGRKRQHNRPVDGDLDLNHNEAELLLCLEPSRMLFPYMRAPQQ